MRFISKIAVSMAVAYTIAGCGGSAATGDKTQEPSPATENDAGNAEEQGKHGLVGAATNALTGEVDKCQVKTGELEAQIAAADELIKKNEAAMKALEKEIANCAVVGEELAAAPAKLALEFEEKALMDLPLNHRLNDDKVEALLQNKKRREELVKVGVNGENPNAEIKQIMERLSAIRQELSADGADNASLQSEVLALYKKLDAYQTILAEKPNRQVKARISTFLRAIFKQLKKNLEERRRIGHAFVYGNRMAGVPVPKALSDELANIHEQIKQIESLRF